MAKQYRFTVQRCKVITNFKCTIYHFNGVGYIKFYVPHCHWQENKASNVVKSGLQNTDSVTVYIPLDSLVITPSSSLLPAKDIFPGMKIVPKKPSQDLIVKGYCDFEFNNTDQKTVSESMKEFNNSFSYNTIMSIDIKDYGAKRLQHIKISGK